MGAHERMDFKWNVGKMVNECNKEHYGNESDSVPDKQLGNVGERCVLFMQPLQVKMLFSKLFCTEENWNRLDISRKMLSVVSSKCHWIDTHIYENSLLLRYKIWIKYEFSHSSELNEICMN